MPKTKTASKAKLSGAKRGRRSKKAKKKFYVGLNAWARVVAIPEDEQSERAILWSGLKGSQTWGQLKEAISAADCAAVAAGSDTGAYRVAKWIIG